MYLDTWPSHSYGSSLKCFSQSNYVVALSCLFTWTKGPKPLSVCLPCPHSEFQKTWFSKSPLSHIKGHIKGKCMFNQICDMTRLKNVLSIPLKHAFRKHSNEFNLMWIVRWASGALDCQFYKNFWTSWSVHYRKSETYQEKIKFRLNQSFF